jgi:spore maturation protein CgeB
MPTSSLNNKKICPPSLEAQHANSRRVLMIHKGCRVHTWSADLADGFREVGCDARVLALRSWNWPERREQWAGGGKLWENRATLERCAGFISAFHPELIILLNYAGLPEAADSMIRKAAGSNVPLVGCLADHITALPASSRPNLNGVYAFDSATLEVLVKAYQNSGARLEFLPLAVNLARYRDRGRPWSARHKGLVFLGNNTMERRALIREFRALGGTISAYGPKAEAGFQFWRRRRVSPQGAARIYGSYQGVLNLLQAPNTINGLNLRAFEVPAGGGLGTYPLTPDLALSFDPGREIIAYRDMADLARQTRMLFNEPELAANVIAAGRARVMAEHTYAHRASRLVTDWLPAS